MDVLTIVGLIVSVIGGALGAFSIFVTWKLYQAGNSLNLETLRLLHQVSTSSHTTEVTSTHYTDRLVTALIELTQKGMRDNLERGLSSVTKRVEAALNENLADVTPEVAARINKRVQKDLTDTFRALEYDAAAITQLPESELSQPKGTQRQVTMLAPGVPRVLQWIAKNQNKYQFLSVKYLREKVFARDPPLQEALQFCIDRGVLQLYDCPNPYAPERPTKACRLNLEHPLTKQILGLSDGG